MVAALADNNALHADGQVPNCCHRGQSSIALDPVALNTASIGGRRENRRRVGDKSERNDHVQVPAVRRDVQIKGSAEHPAAHGNSVESHRAIGGCSENGNGAAARIARVGKLSITTESYPAAAGSVAWD